MWKLGKWDGINLSAGVRIGTENMGNWHHIEFHNKNEFLMWLLPSNGLSKAWNNQSRGYLRAQLKTCYMRNCIWFLATFHSVIISASAKISTDIWQSFTCPSNSNLHLIWTCFTQLHPALQSANGKCELSCLIQEVVVLCTSKCVFTGEITLDRNRNKMHQSTS